MKCAIYMFLNIFYKNRTKTEVAAQNPCDMNLKLINSRCHDTNVTHASITIGFVLLFLWTMIQKIYEPFPPHITFSRPSRPRSLPVTLVARAGSVQAPVQNVSQQHLLLSGQLGCGRGQEAAPVLLHAVLTASWSTKTCIQIFLSTHILQNIILRMQKKTSVLEMHWYKYSGRQKSGIHCLWILICMMANLLNVLFIF